MSVKKRDDSKVVIQRAAGTYLDVRIVHHKEGYGRNRRTVKSEYGIFHSKHRVTKDKFNKPELAVAFIAENFNKYDRKHKKFK